MREGAAYRFFADGGRADDEEDYVGGIMDLESARQMYGLGKLVKKVTRGVKKIVKSPLGKAALLAGGAGLFGFGPAKGLFASGKGAAFKRFLGNKVFGTLTAAGHPTEAPVRMGGILNYIKSNPFKSIFAASTLAGLMTPKQQKQQLYQEEDDDFDIAAIRKDPYAAMGETYRFAADGGLMRQNYAEGSKEPVAKKTMPLLDMDGMEKDYRADGGLSLIHI